MALSPSSIPSVSDMEDFAKDFLGLNGVDVDLFYESYYNIENEDSERVLDELSQSDWEYWSSEGWHPHFFCVEC